MCVHAVLVRCKHDFCVAWAGSSASLEHTRKSVLSGDNE